MIFDYLKAVIDFLGGHPEIAYGLVFLAATVESMPLLGSVIPGSTIVLAVSATAPKGAVGFWPLMLWAVLGAILGDGLSYWLGRRYQRRILSMWPCSRYPQLAQQSESFFEKHGGKSVVIGRFTPALRPFIPLFAGILGMPPRRFYLANIFSALLWAPAHIIPGIALGATLGLAAAVAGRLAGLAAMVVLALWGAAWLARYILRQLLPHLTRAITVLRAWASKRESWLRRQVLALLDPERNEVRALALAALFLIGAAWLFFGVLEDVATGDPLVRADKVVYALMQGFRSRLGDALMTAVTELGDSFVVIAVVVAAALCLILQRAWRSAAYLIVAVAGASLFNSGIKLILTRTRPLSDLYEGLAAFSFPSGHSTVNSVLYAFLGILIIENLRPVWRLPLAIFAASLITLIAISRLYLGAHWFSDVVAGLAFGAVWIALLGTAYQLHRPDHISAHRLVLTAIAALLVAGGINIYRHHTVDLERYAVRSPSRLMTTEAWLGGGWQQLPAQRTDLIGEYEEPLTIQWTGDLATLQQRLAARGWQPAQHLTMTSVLTWITPQPDPATLPAIPLLQEGAAPKLTMIRVTSPNTRLVLRLWHSDLRLGTDDMAAQPLWVGAVVEERLRQVLWPVTLAQEGRDANGPRDQVSGMLAGPHLAARTPPVGDRSWDGRVLLLQAGDL